MSFGKGAGLRLAILVFGLIGCFLGFMGSSLASDIEAKKFLIVNMRPTFGYASSSLGVIGILTVLNRIKIGSYLLIFSIAIGLFSISGFFAGAAFFYLAATVLSFRLFAHHSG